MLASDRKFILDRITMFRSMEREECRAIGEAFRAGDNSAVQSHVENSRYFFFAGNVLSDLLIDLDTPGRKGGDL